MIRPLEEQLMVKARKRLHGVSELVLLGPNEVNKLPILSFVIKCPPILGRGFLHHNFVCRLLNDLFGVQARGGCACAGPYVADLLGMSLDQVQQFTDLIPKKGLGAFERLKPGFVRLCLPWFAPNEEIEYILTALNEVAVHGWKLLPQYEFNPDTGSWKHQVLWAKHVC